VSDSFDYVIVGSGPAGSVLANRLSANGTATVCVLEAGVPDRSIYVRIPAGFVKTLYKPGFMWPLTTEPHPATDSRAIKIPQGKIVGGSSSVNGLAYTRGHADDFNDWAAAGNEGWSYREVLPYFMRSERRIGPGDDRYRGRTGELAVTNPHWPNPLCEAFIQGAVEAGIPVNPDYNGATQEGWAISSATSTAAGASAAPTLSCTRQCVVAVSTCGCAPWPSPSSSKARARWVCAIGRTARRAR
jgi:choline dehydrogenase